MRSSDRFILAAVVVVIVALVGVAWSRHHHPAPAPQPPDTRALVARTGYYVGVAEANEIASYRPIGQFAKAIGRQPNLVLYYSAWGDPFQTRLATEATHHGAFTFVQMDPDSTTKMSAVANGRYDGYLRSYADQVRAYRRPVLIGFAPEMNGDWDSWGWHHTKPSTWIAAWRHVVTIFREQGAGNAHWLWTVNARSSATGPIRQWWPGSQYVDWIGIDGYYFYSNSTFANVFGPTLARVRAITRKPVLLSETAIGQVAGQAAKIPDLFAGIWSAHVLGFVWFDQPQHQGIYHQDWQLKNHAAAVRVFRNQLREYHSS